MQALHSMTTPNLHSEGFLGWLIRICLPVADKDGGQVAVSELSLRPLSEHPAMPNGTDISEAWLARRIQVAIISAPPTRRDSARP